MSLSGGKRSNQCTLAGQAPGTSFLSFQDKKRLRGPVTISLQERMQQTAVLAAETDRFEARVPASAKKNP